MSGFSSDVYNCDGTLTIGGISMNRAAWAIVGDDNGRGGLLRLWATVEQRGENRKVPGNAGVIPYQKRVDETEHELRLLINGDVDLNGTVTSDSKVGLVTNINYIYSNVVAPTGTGDGTRSAVLTFPSLSSRTASVHVKRLELERYNYVSGSAIFEGTLLISIPAGRFA